jgi:hypothetical protein
LYTFTDWAGIPSGWDKARMGWQFHHFGDPAIEIMVTIPMISITAPEKGDLTEQRKTCEIRWSSNIKGDVKIDLCKGGSLPSTLSAAIVATDGMYQWVVPDSNPVGTDYQIRITSVDSSALLDTGNTFSIIPEYLLVAP